MTLLRALTPEPSTVGDGRYELLSLLGRGSTAAVYRARDQRLGVDRAIKLFDPDQAPPHVLHTRIAREAAIVRRLSHPTLVPVYAVGEDHGMPWLAMELVVGQSMRTLVKTRGTVSALQAVGWIDEVLGALAVAHDLGVIHRDVRPANLLLDRWDRPRLIDWGIAWAPDQPTLAAGGYGIGSLGWSPPEQLRDGTSVGPQADVYSTAATLYWLISGLTPIDLHRCDRHSPRWAAVPLPLVPVLSWAMAEEPRDRYRDARAFREALRIAEKSLRGQRNHWRALAR